MVSSSGLVSTGHLTELWRKNHDGNINLILFVGLIQRRFTWKGEISYTFFRKKKKTLYVSENPTARPRKIPDIMTLEHDDGAEIENSRFTSRFITESYQQIIKSLA